MMESISPVAGAEAREPRVVVRNLTKVFHTRRGSHKALDDVSLEVGPGEAMVLLGPSGCGKTTLLRCVAGLETPDSGEIVVHGRVVFSSRQGIYHPPERRRLGMVFQSYALWPHMTVAENVAYPLRNNRVPAADVQKRVAAVLELVGLGGHAAAYSGQLSGGQQQRVALARAIVANEGVVLFDEPLSNLDAKVRERLRIELLSMQRDIGFSSLYVTHDQVEAMALADRIAVMSVGRIAQLGKSDDIYRHPASRYVANFIGKSNELPGKIAGHDGAYVVVETAVGAIRGRLQSSGAGEDAVVLFRPENLVMGAAATGNRIAATLKHSMFLGTYRECVFMAGATPLVMAMGDRQVPSQGTKVDLAIDPDHVLVFGAGEPSA